VDLERVVAVGRTKLTFPSEGSWRYKIEISADGNTGWRMLVDQSQATSNSAERTDQAQGGSISGRFVRVSIVQSPAGQPAALSEVEVFGTQAGQ
jgi:hypothetical protein